MQKRITSFSKKENRDRKHSNSNIPQPPERKFLDVPKTRKGWSEGEWKGFYDALRAKG